MSLDRARGDVDGRMRQFFIDGEWRDASSAAVIPVDDPGDGCVIGHLSSAQPAEIDAAVAAARRAFTTWGSSTKDDRVAVLEAVISAYTARLDDLAHAVSREMGAPLGMARAAQAMAGLGQLQSALDALKAFAIEETRGTTLIRHEPIGVCALITPWNWPLNQIGAKVGPALAAGCTMVLKPSEVAPSSALVFAEIVDAAGVPAGVFNLVNGTGADVGAALAAHPGVDLVSFTGSTRAGAAVAVGAAPTVKRMCQELGGKSAHIILDDVDVPAEVARAVRRVFGNTGQSCDSVARILIPAERVDEAVAAARAAAESVVVGHPADAATDMGPLASRAQLEKVTGLVRRAVQAGARLVAGGVDRPAGLADGYYVQPTVLADVEPAMEIAQEEVFGPVALLMAYTDVDDAVAIANDSVYGLSGRVSAATRTRALDVARRLRTGMVYLNDADADFDAPFGGYRMSGNGREGGEFGLREYVETQAIMGGDAGTPSPR